VIAGVHTILNAYDAEAARAFFRDILGFESVDAGGGWLIFELPPGELACHPGPELEAGQSEGGAELFLLCKDIETARAELEAKGVEFVEPVADHGYGLVTRFRVPGYGNLAIYEPHHPSPLGVFASE
jgi:catechol 2,3-dioxygenase-like lactoylglutathione lyase family enzyme